MTVSSKMTTAATVEAAPKVSEKETTSEEQEADVRRGRGPAAHWLRSV